MKTQTPVQYYSIEDTMNLLGVRRTTIYELFKYGHLQSVKLGARRLIPESSIMAYQEKLARLYVA